MESSWSIGAVFMGIIGSRPDDEIGVAIGMLTANKDVVLTASEDAEMVFEAYYKYVTEGGKMQITPHIQYIGDPGAGASFAVDDSSLFIIGLRIHIPF